MGLPSDPELQPVLLGLFLSMCLVAVLGNLLIILAFSFNSDLHKPMYFFLSNLSLADVCVVSTTVPKMIVNIQTHRRIISYMGCLTQLSVFIIFGCMDDLLLTVMTYDHFVSICHPLHYSVIMNPCLCDFLVLVSFLVTLFESHLHNLIALQITCFKDVEIANFYCDTSQVLNLSSSGTSKNNVVLYFVGATFDFVPISGIFLSCYKIVSSILKIPSPGGKCKVFSTCGSHLSAICFFYGTGFGVYLGTAVSPSSRKGAVASVMYTAVTPMLNPFICSLTNRDINSPMKRISGRIF